MGDSGDHQQKESTSHEFDTNLPTEHSYLGHMDNLHGYTLFDEGIELDLLGIHTDTIVCPGYTLPLLIDYHRELEIMKEFMQTSKTFVLVMANSELSYNTSEVLFSYGVTMEIIEYSETAKSLALKAKGRQRCKIIKQAVNLSMRMGKVTVRILPEIDLSGPLIKNQIAALNNARVVENSYENLHKNRKYRRYDSAQMRWPLWLYNQYELHVLGKKIRMSLKPYAVGDCLPYDPVKLSYWFMQNFQLNHNERLEILKLDSAVQRLRLELYYLKMKRLICCCRCNTVIAKQTDIIQMSKDGIQSNYCNPGGHVYETLTVSDAFRVNFIGQPSEQFSWFPGYAWTMAQCAQCFHHLGWRFESKKLKPNKFYGLAKNCIVAKIIHNYTV